MPQTIKIGVTDCSKYRNYANWISAYGPEAEVIKLTGAEGLENLRRCDGVLLTGGEDVHPRFYNQPEMYDYCYKDDVSEERDEFEWKILEYTEANKIPVLGICRGLQIANVFFGGTLIPDIPTWGKYNHSKLPDDSDRYHAVSIDPNSRTYAIIGETEGTVNSNHHQSAAQIGRGLIVSAFSPDGIVEAMERKNPAEGAFLCLVQWHPERMKDQHSNFVQPVRAAFMKAAASR
ncbi:MAG: gamma-glutamyl-gamma-aminobutyrate hydrolase family protein [Chitinophagaceae bacterium]|nr:gamma-glutamyl-gamma-aminobutyrate hydrolase family protein [Chitinophagaceae bacterium]MCW5925945.1 gamma-glutamyl-gamma-aminobutyrate hydrolase family protein [Chitinophagaceae bacterium]